MLPWPTTVHLNQVQNEADWGFEPALHLKFNIDAKLGRFLYSMIERRLVDNIIDNAGPICHTCAPTIFRNFHAFSLLCMQISSPRTPWHALFSKLFYHASFCVLNICAVKNELRNGGKIRYVYSRTLFVSIRHK